MGLPAIEVDGLALLLSIAIWESARPNELRRQLDQLGHRQSDHVPVVAFDLLDQGGALALDRVAAGAVPPFAAPQVTVHLGRLQQAEADACHVRVGALVAMGAAERDTADHLVSAAGKATEED